MTVFAAIVVRRRPELTQVGIFVTQRARSKLELIDGRSAGREVALCARYSRMLAFQRIGCGSMFLHSERRRFEAAHRVA